MEKGTERTCCFC